MPFRFKFLLVKTKIFFFLITDIDRGFIKHVIIDVANVTTIVGVEGDQKVPFSIATTPRCRGGRYSFPWIAPLYP